MSFRYLTEKDGLTNSYVYTICQDMNGFIWIGTDNGLFRYDGQQFLQYLNQPGDMSSINSNVIYELFRDSRNRLWIGSFMGLMRYDERRDVFIDYRISNLYREGLPLPVRAINEDKDGTIIVTSDFGLLYVDPKTLACDTVPLNGEGFAFTGNALSAYHIDREDRHWLATDHGVFMRDPVTGSVLFYNLSEYARKKFPTTYIHDIYQDTKGNVWVTTREDGVFLKPAGDEKFHQFLYDEENRNSLGSNECYTVYEDGADQVWISTNGGGLNLYQDGKFVRVKHSATAKGSLLNNNPRAIYEDRQGNLWIASFQAGISVYLNHPQLFKHYPINIDQQSDYQSTIVCSIYAFDENRKVWVGTDGGGLKILDRENNRYKTYLPTEDHVGSFPDKVVMSIYKDKYNTFWFGTYQGGLVKYNEKTDRFRRYQYDPDNPRSINSNFVTSILEDSRGKFWVGTNGGGLNLFDRETESFRAYMNDRNNPNSLIDDFINDMIEDHSGNIWLATFWGLSRFDPETEQFNTFLSDKSVSASLSHNTVFCLLEDSENRIWVGTRNGLNLYHPDKGTFTYFTEKDGLAGNTIYNILEDHSGKLWISTNRGLSEFSPDTREFVNFSESDGLQANEFFRNSGFKAENDELFFGGINGFNAFFPDEVKPGYTIPPLVVTGFKIFDREIPIGQTYDNRILLKKAINTTSKLELEYSDKIFSFEVSAIDFFSPEEIVYAYRLEGFDADWNYTDSRFPVITYTNLNPGDYRLLIKAGNKNIIHSIEPAKAIDIHISPPFWKTWWAYSIYIITLLLAAYLTWRLAMQRIREREFIRLERLKREKAEELNQAKLRFFTNISHEFRTPLTLIIAPLEKLINNPRETTNFKRQLDIMLKNARRMLRLINQLLDFRKFEGGKMNLQAEHSDVISFISDIADSFEEYASEKQINFKYLHHQDEYKLWFDADKLDKILFNLLSNAFKFTPEKGSVILEVDTDCRPSEHTPEATEYLRISVSDTGNGIPEKEIPRLFERFYQAESKSSSQQGSGLGLTLTRNFVDIHSGHIEVKSSNAGTTFRVYLPQGDHHLSEEQKFKPESPGINKYLHHIPELSRVSPAKNGKNEQNQLHNKPTLLLVEDNLDLRNYLEEECSGFYNFYSAADGMEGYELAVDILPDLIISDVMMPQMSGYEFCKRIKHNILTSHIPVILLTAKTAVENEIEGYESGADAYIPKPFLIDQLIASANAIIENRVRLREKFNAGKVLSSMPIRNTADDKFLQRVTDSVNTNISEVEFGVLELSKDLGISRVHLHRKLKAIANVSPNEFIKNIRLQTASEILIRQEFNVSEVCYKVGFNSPAYFSSCFKAYYKMSPTEFIEKNLGG
ncbi:MAG: response regulator [Bacteroidales bacterium]|nr:response regulator [Bacteroidales bacterium]